MQRAQASPPIERTYHMKEITKTSRLAGNLEKIFSKLNASFFNGELPTPVITIQSTPKAYGHYTKYNAWNVKGEDRREINIGAGTLDRPIEYTVATMLHEMCHMYNDLILKEQDTSRSGTYHNKVFKAAAESHGLICNHTEKYGWSNTSAEISDTLIDWILSNDVAEIMLNRNEGYGIRITGGAHTANGGAVEVPGKPKNNSRRYHCPSCGMIVRATRAVNVGCWDCMIQMVEG